jgi:DNA-directed RNA polymerase subunit omega
MLVNVVANRARKIASESEHSGVPLTEKPVSMAVQEVADGTLIIEPEMEITEGE